jgi:hypothetical protein
MPTMSDKGDQDADDPAVHYDLASAYAEMGMLEDAIAELTLVLEANPRHTLARAAIVELRHRLSRLGGGPPDEVA